jgi:outer membrane protein
VAAERLGVLVLGAALAGCSAIAGFARPEGDGGWTPAERHAEVAARAAAAGVDLGTGVVPPAAPGPLDLAAVVALAAQGNRRIAAARRDVEIARARVAEARGRLLPDVTGAGRYTRYTDPQTTGVAFPPGLLPRGLAPPVVTVREAEVGVVNGTLAVPLDLTGELRHALGAAQAGYRGEQARLWATTLEQEVAAIRAYFQLLEAEHLRAVTEQTVAADREQLAAAQARFDAGRLTKNQLLVVQVTVRDAEQELLRRELAIDQARWALNDACGLPVNAPTEVVDVPARPEVPAVDDALRAAYAHNPVVVALLEDQQRLEETARSLARGRLPRVAAGGAIDYSTETILQPQRIGSGFVGFTWDLGTDGRREAEIAEARQAVERTRIELERDLREIEASVRATQQAAAERLAALAAAEAAVGQAEENLRIRREQFAVGRAQSEDVLDAEALLARQRATLASALYEAHTRRAELQQLMGLPLEAVVPASR